MLASIAATDSHSSTSASLFPFLALVYADLKTQRFVHWFAYPTLCPPSPFTTHGAPTPLAHSLSADDIQRLRSGIVSLAASSTDPDGGSDELSLPVYFEVEVVSAATGDDHRPFELATVAPLGRSRGLLSRDPSRRTWFGFVDPCSLAEHPGWPLRCVLASMVLSHKTLQLGFVSLLCYNITSVSCGHTSSYPGTSWHTSRLRTPSWTTLQSFASETLFTHPQPVEMAPHRPPPPCCSVSVSQRREPPSLLPTHVVMVQAPVVGASLAGRSTRRESQPLTWCRSGVLSLPFRRVLAGHVGLDDVRSASADLIGSDDSEGVTL